MGDWSRTSGARYSSAGDDTSVTNGTSVTSAGTANTKGAWTTIVASTPHPVSGILLCPSFNAGSVSYLLDIGVGGSGSETILIPDLHFSGMGTCPPVTLFPLGIPQGSRIAARSAASSPSEVIRFSCHLLSGGFDEASSRCRVTAYGVAASDSGGVSVDPGAAAHTKGAWTTITASTTATIHELMIAAGNQSNPVAAAAQWLADIGVGAAGSERILLADYRLHATLQETLVPSMSPLLPVSIPPGSRLAVRSQCSITDATDRLIDFVLYGVT